MAEGYGRLDALARRRRRRHRHPLPPPGRPLRRPRRRRRPRPLGRPVAVRRVAGPRRRRPHRRHARRDARARSDRELSAAPSIEDDPVAAYRAARADVEALLADPRSATSMCDTPMGRMTIAEHIDGVVSADLVLHGGTSPGPPGSTTRWTPPRSSGCGRRSSTSPTRCASRSTSAPAWSCSGPRWRCRTTASKQDRLLGKIGRDPAWVAPG